MGNWTQTISTCYPAQVVKNEIVLVFVRRPDFLHHLRSYLRSVERYWVALDLFAE